MKRFPTGYRPGMDARTAAGSVSAAVLVSALLAGCGSDDDLISSANADALHAQVTAIRTAVADGREPAALAAVAELRSTIRRLLSSGELDPADTAVLLTQVDRIESRLEDRTTPTPTPTPTAQAEVPADSGDGEQNGGNPKDEPKDEPKGKGNGKGKEKGKGNG